ncbi:MAG: PIN domain-containing protein [bacterium]
MKYLLDTNTIIYWWKNNENIEKKVIEAGFDNIYISFTVASELFFGAYNSVKVENNLNKIFNFLEKITVIESNINISHRFGKIKSELKKSGKMIDDADIFIASTALEYDFTLVTNNTKHFNNIENLKLVNWV